MKNLIITVITATALSTTPVFAEIPTPTSIESIANAWADTTFLQPKATQLEQYRTLTKAAKSALANNPKDADMLTWAGIVTSSYAGSRGGLGALKMAKRAKKLFERAMQIDPEALDGGARTSLGTLYHHVPGWPLAFGNAKTAEKLLSESAEKHPNNIDALYFYADFLLDKKRFPEAKINFEKAALITEHSSSPIALTGRHSQIREKLSFIKNILS